MVDEPSRRALLTQLAGFRRKYGTHPFAVLDLNPLEKIPTARDIHAAYLNTMKTAHPDVSGANVPPRYDAFAVNEAHELLMASDGIEAAMEFVYPSVVTGFRNLVNDSDLTGFRAQLFEIGAHLGVPVVNTSVVRKRDNEMQGKRVFNFNGKPRRMHEFTGQNYLEKINGIVDRILGESEDVELSLERLRDAGFEAVTFDGLADELNVETDLIGDSSQPSFGNRAFCHMRAKSQGMDSKINIDSLQSILQSVTQARMDRVSNIVRARELIISKAQIQFYFDR